MRFLAVLAIAALFASVPRVACAEDKAAPFHASDVKLTDATLPKGWKLSADDAAAADVTPVKDALAEVAKGAGDVQVTLVAQSASTTDGAMVVFAFLETAAASETFTKAVSDAGASKGWDAKPLGFPTRLVVVAAPAPLRAKAMEVAVLGAAGALLAKAKAMMKAAEDRAAFEMAQSVLDAAVAIDPKFAPARAFAGFQATEMYAFRQDPRLLTMGASHFRAALAKDATGALSADEKTRAQGELAGLLLRSAEASAEARDLLKEAVAGAASVERDVAQGYRYNLACAHGRLKELDEAFKLLTAVLEENAQDEVRGIEHWREDPDFDNLHGDLRWAELLKKFSVTAPSDEDDEGK